jgi:hypothetical protein
MFEFFYFFVSALVLSYFVGTRRWLGLVLLLGLAWSAWFLAWPETVARDDVWWSAQRFAVWLAGVAAGLVIRVLTNQRSGRTT